MRAIAIAIALTLSGCWADWPPSPDGGTDWYAPERCGGEPCPAPRPFEPAPPFDAGTVDVGPLVVVDADTPDEDAGADADADAGAL